MVLTIILSCVFLQGAILQMEACNRMLYLHPSKLYDWDNHHIPVPQKYRQKLGEEIDAIVEKEIDKVKTIKEKEQIYGDLEDIMGYGGNNPCIVLAILDANMTAVQMESPRCSPDPIDAYTFRAKRTFARSLNAVGITIFKKGLEKIHQILTQIPEVELDQLFDHQLKLLNLTNDQDDNMDYDTTEMIATTMFTEAQVTNEVGKEFLEKMTHSVTGRNLGNTTVNCEDGDIKSCFKCSKGIIGRQAKEFCLGVCEWNDTINDCISTEPVKESGSIKPPLMTRDDMATMKYTSLPTESSTLKGKTTMSCTNNKDPFCYECSKHSKLDKPTGQVIKRFCLGDCKWDHNHKTCISHTSAETGVTKITTTTTTVTPTATMTATVTPDFIERVNLHDIYNDILQNGAASNDVDIRARNVHERLVARDTKNALINATIKLKILDANNTFIPYSIYIDEDNNETTVRYEQFFGGYPVIGDNLVLTFNKNEHVNNAFGSAEKLSSSKHGNPCSKEKIILSKEDAIKKAQGRIGVGKITNQDWRARVAIFNGKCVYEIEISSMHITISTETGKILLQESTVQTGNEEPSGRTPRRGGFRQLQYPLEHNITIEDFVNSTSALGSLKPTTATEENASGRTFKKNPNDATDTRVVSQATKTLPSVHDNATHSLNPATKITDSATTLSKSTPRASSSGRTFMTRQNTHDIVNQIENHLLVTKAVPRKIKAANRRAHQTPYPSPSTLEMRIIDYTNASGKEKRIVIHHVHHIPTVHHIHQHDQPSSEENASPEEGSIPQETTVALDFRGLRRLMATKVTTTHIPSTTKNPAITTEDAVPQDCDTGFEKENMKFATTQRLKEFKMENYDFDNCTEACRQVKPCNFMFYTVDFDKDSHIGCHIYNEPDEIKRTIPTDPTKEIFCNKIQQTTTALGVKNSTTSKDTTGSTVVESDTVKNPVIKTTVAGDITEGKGEEMSGENNRPTPKEHWLLGGIVWNWNDGQSTTETNPN